MVIILLSNPSSLVDAYAKAKGLWYERSLG